MYYVLLQQLHKKLFKSIVGIALAVLFLAVYQTVFAQTAAEVSLPITVEEGSITEASPTNVPEAPVLTASTLADQSSWSTLSDVTIFWELSSSVEAVAAELSATAFDEPTRLVRPLASSIEIDAAELTEGVQYLNVQFKNDVGWGAIASYPIRIDTTPPEAPVIEVLPSSQGSFPLIVFSAEDLISEVVVYKIAVADQSPVFIRAGSSTVAYQVGELVDGTYVVEVTAFDAAGNASMSTTTIEVVAGWAPAVAFSTEHIQTTERLFLVVLLLLVVVLSLVAYGILLQHEYVQRERKIKKESREVQEQLHKVFRALRDEVEDQINALNKRPKLSKREQEVVGMLQQTLSVSEALITKEINDVRRLVE